MKMQEIVHEVKMLLVFIFSNLLSIWSIVERKDVTFWLGTIGTVSMIVYYCIRIWKDLKGKKDVG
jgi:hypothetical protein